MSTYQESTYRSRSLIKRWLHQRRFDETLKTLNLKTSDLLLDYGCGDGYLLKLCSKSISSQNLYGFEPANNMYEEAIQNVGKKIKIVQDLKELNKKFTKISCLETCEHLIDDDLKILLINIENLLESNGQVIISVPIEIGIPAMLKNLFRFFKNKNYDNLTFKNYINTIFGLTVPRNTNQKLSNVDYIYSHIGFDHRKFELLLNDYFRIQRKYYSPTNFFRSELNNTTYYICGKK